MPAVTVSANDPAVIRAFALGVDRQMMEDYYHRSGYEAPDPLILAAGQPVAVSSRDITAAQAAVDQIVAGNGGQDAIMYMSYTTDPESQGAGLMMREMLYAVHHLTIQVK